MVEQLRAAQAAGRAPSPEPGRKLALAIIEGDGAAVARLLAAGADPSASSTLRTAAGEVIQTTAMVLALREGQLEAARMLLDGGAESDRDKSDCHFRKTATEYDRKPGTKVAVLCCTAQ